MDKNSYVLTDKTQNLIWFGYIIILHTVVKPLSSKGQFLAKVTNLLDIFIDVQSL